MPVRLTRRRYLKFFVSSNYETESFSIFKVIKNSLFGLYGIKGLIDSNLQLITYDEKIGIGIIRCNHTSLREIRAAIAMITSIESNPISIHIMKCSGTINSLKKKNN